MTYDQILTLDTIIKYGSFKAASEVMHKSQPSLSMAIKKLEEEFNITLFNREHYRPQLTDAGKQFYKKAKTALSEFQKLEKLGNEMGAGLESEISICIDSIFPVCYISHALESFFDPFVTTTLNVDADVLEGVIKKLLNHEVDFAFGPDFKLDDKIEKIKIADVEIAPVIAYKHKEKVMGNIDYLKSIPQIVVSSSVKEEKENVRGIISNQIWYTSDFAMREQLIEVGLGWGRLPIHLIQDKLNTKKLCLVQEIPSVQPSFVPMYLLRSKSKIMGPNTKKLWDYLAESKIG